MSSQISKREENNSQKKVKHRGRADSGPLVELLSPSGRTLERVTKPSGASPNKLSKSKSDNILRLFRRSSDRHLGKLLPEENLPKSEEKTNPNTESSAKSNPSSKGGQKSYKAFRSGTGPLILIPHHQPNNELKTTLNSKNLLPDNNKIVVERSELTTIPDKINLNSLNNLKKSEDSIKITSTKLDNDSLTDKKASQVVTEVKAPKTRPSDSKEKESVVFSSNKENSRKIPDQTTAKLSEKPTLLNVKEKTFDNIENDTETENISKKAVEKPSVTQSIKSDSIDIKSRKNISKETNHFETKGTLLLKKLLGQEKSVTFASKETTKEPHTIKNKGEEPQISKISKLKEHWEDPQNTKERELIEKKSKLKPSVEKRDESEREEPNKLDSKIIENENVILKNEHRKLTKTSNINEKSKTNNLITSESNSKAAKPSELKNNLIVDKLPPKCPTTKKSLPLEPPAFSNQSDESLRRNEREVLDSEEFFIDNESFHNQQIIRENQEKKILELHLKHLQEIQKLRSQAKDYRLINSSVPDSPPAVLLNKRKQYSFTNTNETTDKSSTLPPCKLTRSITYDNPSDFYNPNRESDTSSPENFTTNSLPRKSSKKYCTSPRIKGYSTSQIPEQKFSFSSYLLKTRSNSVGEKDKKPLIEEKKKEEVKIDLPKRVHFPDDSKLDSTSVEKKQEKNNNCLVNTDGRISTISENSKLNSSKSKKVSILKKSCSVDDPQAASIDLNVPPIDFSKELTNLSAKVVEITTVAAPVKPPRVGKGLRKAQSVDEGCQMRQVMPSCGKKDPEMKQNPQNHGKENSEPIPILYNKTDTFQTSNQSHNQRFTESQKRKYQQESNTTQSEIKPPLSQDIIVKKVEKFETKSSHASTRPPQPPSRGHKPHFKGQNGQTNSLGCKGRSLLDTSEGQLVTACKVGDEEQILKLLRDLSKTSPLDNSIINQLDHSRRTALSHACSNGYFKVVEFLTSQPHIDLNLIDSEGNTPLHYAAQGGHFEVVSHLVNTCNRQVDLDVRNNLGFTPLMKAALQGRTKIAKILLFAGASPHLRDYGKGLCAVEWAKYTGRSVCSELIESIQRSCSNHIKERWSSDLELKGSSHSGSNYSFSSYQDNKDSWLKHKIKKAFNKSESKKEFNVAANLPTIAVCVSSPILPNQVPAPETGLPKVQVTEVAVPDCYIDPETCKETAIENSGGEDHCDGSGIGTPSTTVQESNEVPHERTLDLNDNKEHSKPSPQIPTIEVQHDEHGNE